MKRALSLLLCLVLLLGLVPGALAVEDEDEDIPAVAVDEGEEYPAPPPVWEEPAEKPYVEELPVEPEDEDEVALMANTAAVTATVSFPAGTSAVGELRIYLVRAAETNGTGLVTREPSIRSQTATVNGSGSFTVSFSNVEAGEYFFGVYSSNADLTGLSSETYYLNADGTRAAGQYTATTFRVAEGASVSRSFTLLKPARSISGTLQFTSPLPQDLRLEVMSNGGSGNSYSYFTASAGATQVPFSVSADEIASVYIDFYNTSTGGSWHRYCINGTLEGEWSEVAYFTPERGSVSGLVINGDALLEGVVASETIPVTVTVKLPEAVTERRRYYVYAFSGSSYRSTSVYAQAGASEFSVTMGLTEGVEYTFAYRDMMGVNRTYSSETFGCRFGAESGITTLQANAKTWTFTGDSGSVVIQEPACLKLTGTLDRGSFMAGGSSIGYVRAVFPDRETYTATVNFEGENKEKTYTIYIPATQQGKTYTLSATRAEEISSNRPLAAGWTESLSGTLTGNGTVSKLSIAADGVTVSGHVELPEGVTIPAGGICAWIRDSSSNLGVRYILREGQTSADFSFTDYTDTSSIYVNATLENGAGISASMGQSMERGEAGFTGLSFAFRRTVTVSGTIRLPEGVRDLGANVEINGSVVTIFPGETEAAYSFQTVLGERVDSGAYLEAETYPCLADGWYYVGADWKFSRESGTRPVATEDKTGVDLVLSKARLVSGTLAADGPALRLIPAASDYRYISVGVSGGGSNRSWSTTIGEDLSWSLKVPEEMAENCRIYVSIQSNSYLNAVQGTYYYSTASGAVTASSEAATLTIPESGLSGLTVHVTTGWVLQGSLTAPAGGTLSNTSSSSYTTMSVYAQNESTNYYGYARVEPGTGPWSFSIVVPAAEDTYTFRVNSTLSSSWTTNLIFRATSEERAISGDTAGIQLPLPMAKSAVTGSVFRPEDYTGYLYANIYVEMVNGEETGETYSAGINVSSSAASGSYRVLIPETETMTRYRVRVRVSSDNSYLASQIWLTETGATTKQAEAAVFTLQTESRHDFTPIRQPSYLSGKIYIPEGIDETFSISIRGITYHSFTVDPASCPSDANGKYYAYSLRYSRDSETTYRPYYSISTEQESDLYTGYSVYILPDGTATTNYSDAQDFTYTPGVESSLDFTLLKSIRLSGAFTDENGTAVRWTRGDSTMSLCLRDANSSSSSYSLQVAEDGSWTCKLPPDKTGSYYAYVYPDSGDFERVLSNNYYYSSEGKVVTDQAQASALEIGAAGLSGLTIRMNTGWLLTGRLTTPEGAYNRLKEGYSSGRTYNISLYARNSTTGQSYYGYAAVDVSTGPWAYSITVPKEAGTFTVSTYGSTFSDLDTNILFDQAISADGVEVSGDTTVPDLELLMAKAVIKGTVTRPEDFTSYISVRVNILTASDELYTAYPYLYSSSDSAEYTISIPSSDTAETYRVRCNVSVSGLVSQAWLTAEGTLSKNEADAKVFTFGKDSDTHDFTLLKLPPYISGKIYIPEDAEGSISIYIRGYGYSQYVNINTENALRDAGGRYVPYALTYEGEEFDFQLYYQVNSDPTGLLMKPYYNSYFYVAEDGGFTTTSGEARTFHYTGESFTQDLKLLEWNDWNDRFVLQSGHGVEAGTYTYTYTIPEGATSVTFHFAYADTGLTINGKNYYYYNLNNRSITINRSEGDQVVMVMAPTGSSRYYGFGVDEITVAGDLTAPAAPSVFTESGSDESGILSDVQEGKTLNVLFQGDTAEGVTRKALVAAYDAEGRFLGTEMTDVTISAAGAVIARFDFKPNEDISELKVLLLDSVDYSPEMRQITIKAAD